MLNIVKKLAKKYMDVQNLKIKKANIQRILKLKMAWDRPNLKAETVLFLKKSVMHCNYLSLS